MQANSCLVARKGVDMDIMHSTQNCSVLGLQAVMQMISELQRYHLPACLQGWCVDVAQNRSQLDDHDRGTGRQSR